MLFAESHGEELKHFDMQQQLAATSSAKTAAVCTAIDEYASDEEMLPSVLASIDTHYAAPADMTKVVQGGDGNCWFRVVAHYIFGDAARHDWVRARIVYEVRELLVAELLQCVLIRCDRWDEYLTLYFAALSETKSPTAAAYLHNLEQSTIWAGQVELRAVQRAFKVPVAL
jgi:OTU-like cysteine protease